MVQNNRRDSNLPFCLAWAILCRPMPPASISKGRVHISIASSSYLLLCPTHCQHGSALSFGVAQSLSRLSFHLRLHPAFTSAILHILIAAFRYTSLLLCSLSDIYRTASLMPSAVLRLNGARLPRMTQALASQILSVVLFKPAQSYSRTPEYCGGSSLSFPTIDHIHTGRSSHFQSHNHRHPLQQATYLHAPQYASQSHRSFPPHSHSHRSLSRYLWF